MLGDEGDSCSRRRLIPDTTCSLNFLTVHTCMGEDVLTFDELRKAQSTERDKDTLQELSEDFFDRARNYLDLKKDAGNYVENKEYRNAKHVLEDIIDRRQKKIVNLAVLSVKSNMNVDNLLRREEELFNTVKEYVADHRSQVQQQLFDKIPTEQSTAKTETPETNDDAVAEPNTTTEADDAADVNEDTNGDASASTEIEESKKESRDDTADETPHVFGVTEDDDDESETERGRDDSGTSDGPVEGDEGAANPEDEPSNPDAESAGNSGSSAATDGDDKPGDSDEHDADAVAIRVTQRVPEFMGVDLNAYGPFEEGDEVHIPLKNAEVLIDQGKAEEA